MENLIHFAQTATTGALSGSTFLTILGTVIASLATGVASVWGWFRKELDDCKRDRKELFDRVEQLHDKVSDLSRRIGPAN